ncbi:MAG TPA: LysE family transporter [Acidobacteriaceae bacterium]
MKDMFGAIAKGIWIGICIAAPVGPIGTLVLKKSLRWGLWAGLMCGLGAALADLCYGLLASAGVRLTADYARPIGVLGGMVLLWLAWRSWREEPRENVATPAREAPLHSIATTFLLTLANPMTILSFAALIASVGSGAPVWFVAGIFLGSMLWWITLCGASSWLFRFIEVRSMILNRVAAVTLAAFGIWAIYSRGLK